MQELDSIEVSRPKLRRKTTLINMVTVKPRLRKKLLHFTLNPSHLNPAAAEFCPTYQSTLPNISYRINLEELQFWRTVDGENVWVSDQVLIRQTRSGEIIISR